MLQGEYKKEGMQNYLVLPCEKNCVEGYESMLMQYHRVPYMIPYEVREVNEICEIYYRLQYRTTLRAVLGHLPLNMSRLFHMLDSIVGALEMAEEFLFDAEKILWNTEYIFIEADTGRLQFCSYPDKHNPHNSLKQLLTELLQQLDKKDDAAVMYLLQFYNLVTEADSSLSDLRSFVMKYSKDAGRQQEKSRDINETEQERYTYKNEREIKNCSPDREEKKAINEIRKKDKEIHLENERGDKKQEEYLEKPGERVAKWLLIITALFNLGLIVLLLFDILTYDYVRYLIGSMGAMIVFTIIYMNLSKEETPDEIMQAFFEENAIQSSDRVQSKLAYAGVGDGCQMSEYFVDHSVNCKENARVHSSVVVQREIEERKSPNSNALHQYGETTVLYAADDIVDECNLIVKEDFEPPLFLAAFVQGKYMPIYIENSVIVGCMEEGCTYLLKQRGISRMHAKLMKKPDGLYLLDLNSTNGTFVNGEAIVSGEEYRLEEGDVVAFAQCEFYVAKTSQMGV